LGKLGRVVVGVAGNFVFYGLAGGVVVSRVAAEFSGAGVEERVCGVVDGFDVVWVFAYYESGISELAVCDFGGDCGIGLWVDLEEDGIDLCVGAGAYGGGCYLAFFVSDDVRDGAGKQRSNDVKKEWKKKHPRELGSKTARLRLKGAATSGEFG